MLRFKFLRYFISKFYLNYNYFLFLVQFACNFGVLFLTEIISVCHSKINQEYIIICFIHDHNVGSIYQGSFITQNDSMLI
jgi:hypothetical protein